MKTCLKETCITDYMCCSFLCVMSVTVDLHIPFSEQHITLCDKNAFPFEIIL